MKQLCAACLLLVLAGAKGFPSIQELVRANNQSSGELPSWYPSTRCSAGVHHTTPPGTAGLPVFAELDTETTEATADDGALSDPLDHVDELVDANENIIEDTEATEPPSEVTSTTTARTTAEYRAPELLTSPALYIDDE